MITQERNISVKKNPAQDTVITSLSATLGDSPGEIDLSWDASAEARSYVVQYSRYSFTGRNKAKWKHIDIVSESYCSVSGLKKGKTYGFRVALINNSGEGDWSKPVYKKIE